MKKLITILILVPFLFPGLCAQHSESFSGIAYYKSSSHFQFDMDNQEIPPAEKAKIQAQLQKSMEKEYELKFNGSESLFSELEKLDGSNAGFKSGGMEIQVNSSEGDIYKNTKTQRVLEESDMMGKAFLIDDALEAMDWILKDEKKYIGKYECQKAVYMQTFKTMELNEVDGESTMTESQDSAEVVVWFALDIPVNQGPRDLWGLPGLILEVESQSTHIVCTKIVLNPDEKVVISMPKSGKKVSSEEYSSIRDKKMKEMQEKYRGHGNGQEHRVIISSGN